MLIIFVYVAIFVVSAWLLYNTFRDLHEKKAAQKPLAPDFNYADHPEVAKRLAKAISFKSITRAQDNTDTDEVAKFLAYLEQEFPLMHGGHKLVTCEVVNEFSRLFKVEGSDADLNGILLNAHTDVVPTENQAWTADPFNTGITEDGWIFGRGAIDDKGSVLATMESISYLLRSGFEPRRTIWVAICHDEEAAGLEGAKKVVEKLVERNVQLEFVHDEGMMVFHKLLPGLKKDVALVGVTEKGYLDVQVQLKLDGNAGHSAVPVPGQLGVISKLSQVAYNAEKRPLSMYLNESALQLFYGLSNEMIFPVKFFLRNIRIFWPVVKLILGRIKMGNLFKSTSTVTMFHGGLKRNVLPAEASMNINHRIHPEDSVKKLVARDQSLLTDDHMKINLLHPVEPQPTAPFDGTALGYHSIKASIEQVMGPQNVVVVPGLMVAASDSRHYCKITKACYRFLPTRIQMKDSHRYHGHDEKISVDNYEETINFYINMIKNSNATSVAEIYA